MSDDVSCPFCGDTGYDLIGLKQHLEGNFLFSGACEAYENTMSPQEEADKRRAGEQRGEEGGRG